MKAFLFLIALGLPAPARAQFIAASSYITASSATVSALQLTPTAAPSPSVAGQLYYDSTYNVVWLSTASNSTSSWVVIAPRGVYLGLTPATYTGNLGGDNGAAAKCSLTWPGSRMCTISEVMALPGPLPSTNGWAGQGTTAQDNCNNSLASYTSASASFFGSIPNRNNGNTNIGAQACSTAASINCCR